MKYSEEMRLIFKGYSKEEIANLKKAEEDEEAAENEKKDSLETDPKPNEPDEETIKKFEDYESQIEALTKKNKELEDEITKINNHQTLGEPEKRKDAADVMSELFSFKKKEEN